jgi:hypothetical protein
MAIFRIASLLWLSSILLLLGGCIVANKIPLMDSFTNCPPVFQPVIRTASYSAQLDFYKKHISGIFIFKAMNDTTERVVFMTETGFKFFDFEYTPHRFQVEYIIPSLNKKIIINTLHRDLGYLLIAPIENAAHNQLKNDTSTIFKFPMQQEYVYYVTDKKYKKKNLVIGLSDTLNMKPKTINIAHQNFKLTIFMKQINN